MFESDRDDRACVRIQQEVWGRDFADVVPASMLKISRQIGGVSAGAFDGSGRLLGFVFGMTGLENGRLVHWSHMLAVLPEARNREIGRRLKAFQRSYLEALGVERIYWTFDPLVARNAHLNLTRLGASVVEYVADMYGPTGSALHALGTDRLVVSWPVRTEATPDRPAAGPAEWQADVPVVNPVEPAGAPAREWLLAPVVGIEVPPDIDAMIEDDLALAQQWRVATRHAFLGYLERGYRVVAFRREAARCFYVLAAAVSEGA
ncbi:MAG TPA: hypothetical protein VF188_12915 [Longimicrobiales bacterium]